ncbi:membrane hypothetical protein [Bradyrhizobium sp. STM 3843]|uniref:pentapeptide repeat-containing protein n=1 Tax=Bradyrhizobium sp. STM 3843 TaxID=551947 RepID=UPI0002406B91|nr:pentapeptide repeat-containing protein [Bradyrhizobium sp. STM 3843]CCE05775.1 membrane hypothetical protein [Bradyrhizobium sp. STM 3843]
MPTDPKDIGELQKALNDASAKASVLWITFVTFELYLAIAFGSVTHRNLFLEEPIKLPLLNVDLPLVGFFVVAPSVLLVFQFYIFLQLLALAYKATDFDGLLRREFPSEHSSELLRQRLDPFLILQFLVGTKSQRRGPISVSLRFIAWITLAGAPVVILLQAQLAFLPYHLAEVQWFLRLCVVVSLIIIWCFWDPVRADDQPVFKNISPRAWWIVGGAGTFLVAIFSIFVATFPGEFLNDRFSVPFRATLFDGDMHNGRLSSPFSNRLVLADQSFIDPDKLEKLEISRSFRGRDLKGAILDRADLRRADFTGAMLDQASLSGAHLQRVRFGCYGGTAARPDPIPWPRDECTWLRDADLRFTELDGANFKSARLDSAAFDFAAGRNVDFEYAQLAHASLRSADLLEATHDRARLEDAHFDEANLIGASIQYAHSSDAHFNSAKLQGANLMDAKFERANFFGANLQAVNLSLSDLSKATLDYAQLQGASLFKATLERATFVETGLQGASVIGAHLAGVKLDKAYLWRASGSPEDIDPTVLEGANFSTRPWGEISNFDQWLQPLIEAIPDPKRAAFASTLSGLSPTAAEPEFPLGRPVAFPRNNSSTSISHEAPRSVSNKTR